MTLDADAVGRIPPVLYARGRIDRIFFEDARFILKDTIILLLILEN